MRYESARVFVSVAALTAVVLISFGNPTSVQAQLATMKVYVPFDYYVGSEKFTPGSYTIRHVSGSVHQLEGNGHSWMIMTTPAFSHARNLAGQLIFNQYENYHFLTEVRWEGSDTARALAPSLTEIDVARNIGSKRTVAITGNRD